MFSSNSCKALVACSAICCVGVDFENHRHRLFVVVAAAAAGGEHWEGQVLEFLRSFLLLGVVDIWKIFWPKP